MKRGKCPKCGSANVRRGPKPSAWRNSAGMIPLGTAWGTNVGVQHYVCIGCGYVESYVVKDEDRAKLRKKWKLASERDDE